MALYISPNGTITTIQVPGSKSFTGGSISDYFPSTSTPVNNTSFSGWVDPANGNPTPYGVGILKTEWDKQQSAITQQNSSKANLVIGSITDNGNGTYTYINRDGTPHMGKWGDNYVDNTKPVAVNLTADEIKKAFTAYGFTPTDADLQYWSLKPNTDLTNLHEKLQARKDMATKTQNEQVTVGANGEIVWEDPAKGGLVKFATDPDGSGPLNTSTVFWVNPTTKKIIPIVSAEAYNSFFDTPLENAKIKTITADYLGSDGALGTKVGYQMVPLSQGINGTASDNVYKTNQETINEGNLGTRYGQSPLSTEQVTKALSGIDGFFDLINKDTKFGVSTDLINQIKNDPNQVAFYMNALVYGGYTLADVARDLKRKQLIKDGNTSLSNITVISDKQMANDYYNTANGSAAKTNPTIAPPTYLGDLDMNLLKYPIFNLPADVFNTLVPPFDPNSEEGKAEMAKVQTSFYDIIQKQLNATTEREKAIADENYKSFIQDTKDKYGIYLSNNATTAWGQLNTILNNASAAGIKGSGIEQETIDKQLQATRKQDMLTRKSELSTEEAARKEQLQKYGSAAEIAALSDADKIKYGFKPSTETANFFSAENLRKLYPTLTDDQIKNYQNSILDANGNYRSDLYQTLYQNTYGKSAGLVTPEGGIQPAKVAYQQAKAIEAKALAEEKKYAPYTAGEAFSKPLDTTTGAGLSSSGITSTPKSTLPAGIDASNSDYWSVNPANKLNSVTPIKPVTNISSPINERTQVKDKNGNMITVYKSDIPALRAEGTII